MPESPNQGGAPLRRILHPTDFSAASRIAFTHALKIALQSKAEMEIVHVHRHRLGEVNDVHWTDFPGIRATLARWNVLPADASAEEVANVGLRVKKILSSDPDPLDALASYCERYPPDLLVLATHQREGLIRWLLKPVAEPLARRAHAMTLFVPTHGNGFVEPANGGTRLRRILIPVDHRPNAQAAIEESFFLAAGLNSPNVELRLLHVGTERGMPTLYLPHHPGWKWEERLIVGDPVESILNEAVEWSPQLIVMATEGHRDFLDALRGSTTERVLRGAHCAVLAVPAKS
jgi:nucleotide-binding universal stress UspA family protein